MVLIEWILGVRRGYDGLVIDPCLTKKVPKAKVKRTFRGAVYNVSIDNTAGRCMGVTSITVDGKKITGNVLPVFKDAPSPWMERKSQVMFCRFSKTVSITSRLSSDDPAD